MTEPTIQIHLGPDDLRRAMEVDVYQGLAGPEKSLPPIYFYDDHGSDLFDQITRLAEYYPTRAERALLQAHSGEIASRCQADVLVELGAGTCDKSEVLIAPMLERNPALRYVPFDVSEQTLRDAARRLTQNHQGLVVHGVVGDFGRHLDRIPTGARRVIAFLGSTIGNFNPQLRAKFLDELAHCMREGEFLLLGADLRKAPDRLIAAYDDASGVTAAFNKNVLAVLNRELNADFDPDGFTHEAHWNDDDSWIEMRLVSKGYQDVHIGDLDLDVHFAPGEHLLTEISSKFEAEQLRVELAEAGFEVEACFVGDGDFSLTLARRRIPVD